MSPFIPNDRWGVHIKKISRGIEGVTEIDGRAPTHSDVDAEVTECEVDSLTNAEIVFSGRELERGSAAGVVEVRSDGGGRCRSGYRRSGSRR